MYSKFELLKDVKKSWLPILDNQKLDQIITKLNTYKSPILPKQNNIFECFKYFELNETRLIWLGQDPYINECQAMGLSFSVPKECPIPPSLKNIFQELKIQSSHGDLKNWVINNKFLMLNATLTVFEKQSNSHEKIWKEYTDQLIKDISNLTSNVIFFLLGNFAKSKDKFINPNKHKIIYGIHPSPLSAYKGFFGSKIFEKLETEYKNINKININWQL
jgi:uracil-DNA glycosylase